MEKLEKAPKFDWIDQSGEVHSLIYQGGEFGGKSAEVFAWYASPATLEGRKPRRSDKFPGIVLVHGAAGTAFRDWARQWAERGYAVLAMDLSGRRADQVDENGKPQRLEHGGPDQDMATTFHAIRTEDFSDDWFYHSVENAVRAHSLLLSFDEVEKDRTAVTGISWGGILTCVIASVDMRFKAAVPVYGCGFLDQSYFMHSEFQALGPEFAQRWYSAYDPARYLADCQTPIFFINGTNDAFFPIDITMKSYEAVTKAPKNLLLIPNFAHGHEPVWARTEVARFIDSVINEGPALPTLSAPVGAGETISSSIADPGNLAQSAVLNSAENNGRVNELQWQETPATLAADKVTSTAPATGDTVYFFNLTDSKGDIVSSPVLFPANPSTPNP